MRVIGLTGGVGSGKSTVARIMKDEWGAVLLIADEIGHLAFMPQSETYHRIVAYFGEDILDKNQEINHALLAAEVFTDDEKRKALNAIVHPFVIAYIREQLATYRGTDAMVVLESAILIESGCVPLCDEIWYVYVPEHIRRERLRRDRHYSDAKIDSIMEKQLPDENFRRVAGVVIDNGKELAKVREEIGKHMGHVPVKNPSL